MTDPREEDAATTGSAGMKSFDEAVDSGWGWKRDDDGNIVLTITPDTTVQVYLECLLYGQYYLKVFDRAEDGGAANLIAEPVPVYPGGSRANREALTAENRLRGVLE